jgi:hypothetical protein
MQLGAEKRHPECNMQNVKCPNAAIGGIPQFAFCNFASLIAAC